MNKTRFSKAWTVLIAFLLVGSVMSQTKQKSEISIEGTWSTYVPNDRPYGCSIAVYDFKRDGSYQIIVIPVPKDAVAPIEKGVVGNPIQNFVTEGRYRVKDGQLFLTENPTTNGKVLVRAIARQENLLVVTMPEPEKQILVLMKAQKEGF